MFEIDKKGGKAKISGDGKPMSKTSHTLCPVPFAILTPSADELQLAERARRRGLQTSPRRAYL
jgi:hypothetical protein